jgi:hypothetical protein
MADEQDRWLDRDAAERLLRGEPPAVIDADTRARAEALADALAALVPAPAPTSAELPGEEAAVAAFRAARTARDGNEAALGGPAGPRLAARSSDAGLVRLGRPAPGGRRVRWGRPVRFGLAAAVAAGMIGGVAVAAGTGVLPTPFRDEPGPAASVSPEVTPRQPLVTPKPGASHTGGSSSPTPGATSGAPGQDGTSRDEAGVGSAATGLPGSAGDRAAGRTDHWWAEVRSSCRDMADGRNLGADRQRYLADAAGGSGRVKSFCQGVLGGDPTGDGGGRESGQDGNGKGRKGGDGNGGGGGKGDQDGNGGDGAGRIAPGANGVAGNPTAAPRSLLPGPPAGAASPSPSYSALSDADTR